MYPTFKTFRELSRVIKRGYGVGTIRYILAPD